MYNEKYIYSTTEFFQQYTVYIIYSKFQHVLYFLYIPWYFEPSLYLDLIGVLQSKVLAVALNLAHYGGKVVDVVRRKAAGRGRFRRTFDVTGH